MSKKPPFKECKYNESINRLGVYLKGSSRMHSCTDEREHCYNCGWNPCIAEKRKKALSNPRNWCEKDICSKSGEVISHVRYLNLDACK